MAYYNTLRGYCQGHVHENRYATATGQRKSSPIMDATPVAMTRRSSEGPSNIASSLHRDICEFRLSVASALLCSLIRFASFLPSAPVLSSLCISRSASRLLSPADSCSSLPLSQVDEGRGIAVQIDQPVEVDHHSHQDHDDACADFDLAEMGPEPVQHS